MSIGQPQGILLNEFGMRARDGFLEVLGCSGTSGAVLLLAGSLGRRTSHGASPSGRKERVDERGNCNSPLAGARHSDV